MKHVSLPRLWPVVRLVFLLLLPTVVLAQTRDLCGVIEKKAKPDLSGYDGPIFYDRFGNLYTEDELAKPWKKKNAQKVLIGNFDILFTGFSAAEVATMTAAFEYLSTLIGIGPQGIAPRISVRKKELDPGVLGQGSPYFGAHFCGYANNYPLEMMVSGQTLGNSVAPTAGTLEINSLIDWHTIDSDPISAGTYDLFSVTIHEVLHILGFSSLIGLNGDPVMGFYSRWDLFLYSDNLPDYLLIDDGDPDPGCCRGLAPNPNLIFPDDVAGSCLDEVYFREGGNIAQVYGDYGGLPQDNSTMINALSHLDRCGGPGDQYVMFTSLDDGELRRTLQPEEIEILYALGYPKENNAEVCHVIANNDLYNLIAGNEIPYDHLLANDLVPDGTIPELILQGCGTLIYYASVTPTASGFLIENAPPGFYFLCYSVKGCDGECSVATVTVLNYPPPPPCAPCENNELFCYGTFEEFFPNIGYGIGAQLGLPFCHTDNGYQTTPDIYLASDGNHVAMFFGGDPNYNLEYLSLPLSSPLEPGCEVEICLDVAANLCQAPPSIAMYGTTLEECSGQWDPNCDPLDLSGPVYCLGSVPLSACQEVSSTLINCTHPLYPPGIPCGALQIRVFDEPLTMEQICLTAVNNSNESWDHIVFSVDPGGPMGMLIADNVSITSDCCKAEDPCGVEIVETCKDHSVVLTVLQDGHVIPMYNAPCCVSWSGIGGIPTIGCPPNPGMPAQNFNNIGVAYGQPYSVEVVCGDCTFTYSGIAGDLCDQGGKGGAQQLRRIATNGALRLAPNPVHAQLEISGEALANSHSWEVLDPRGRLLQAGPVTSEVQQLLPTDRLPAGLYLLVLRDLEGQVIEVARFVKE